MIESSKFLDGYVQLVLHIEGELLILLLLTRRKREAAVTREQSMARLTIGFGLWLYYSQQFVEDAA